MKRHKSIWPLPGGIRYYHKTLYRILEFCENNDSLSVLENWMREEYSLEGKKTPTDYLSVLKRLELLIFKNNNVSLTHYGEKVVREKDNSLLFNLLLEKVGAVKEIFDFIAARQPIDKESISEEVEKKLKYGWQTDHQITWRLNWLLSLGIIEITSGKYYLTDSGIEIFNSIKIEKVEKTQKTFEKKKEKIEELSHSDLEDKLKYIGEFFEFESIKRPKINLMLPEDRKLKSSNKELDGLWIKKIPMGGKIYYPIEVQIGGNLSDTIDRLETVSDFAQKAIIVIDDKQEEMLRERLNAKRSKLVDKIVCIKPADVSKILSASNALKSFFQELFK